MCPTASVKTHNPKTEGVGPNKFRVEQSEQEPDRETEQIRSSLNYYK